MKYMIRVVAMVLVSLPLVTLAASVNRWGIIPCDGYSVPCDFKALIALGNNIIKFCIIAGTSVFSIMFMYAGYEYLTAMGNEGQITKAHNYFLNAIIGFVIMLSAWVLVDFILKMLLNNGKSGDYLLIK